MGLLEFIKKISVQTAVYWEPTGNDGYGGKTWADPVEIPVRWDNTISVSSFIPGTRILCNATVLVNQELNPEGYLYLGTLEDFEDMSNPLSIDAAYPIQRFSTIPLIKSRTKFIKIAYL